MNVSKILDRPLDISDHGALRAGERCGIEDEELLRLMVEDAAPIINAPKHIYKRNELYVFVLLKCDGYNKLRTIMDWEGFKTNIQEKVDKYN